MWKWSWAILSALTAIGAVIWTALTYAPAGTDRFIAVLASGAGFLGLSARPRPISPGKRGQPGPLPDDETETAGLPSVAGSRPSS